MSKYKYRIVVFLTVLGPSVIATMAGNDAGGVITYSSAGAKLGYSVLVTLPFLTVLYAVTQEMGSRIAIVTGKGLGDLIREYYGIRIAAFTFILLLLANFGTLITNVAALKVASEMLNLPSTIVILFMIVLAFLLVTKTKYDKSQKIFLAGIFFYLVYVFSALKSNPDWYSAVKNLFIPDLGLFYPDKLLILMAILGTTITPWGQFFVQSYMKDKKVPVENLRYAKYDAFIGAFVSNIFSFFMIVATAATLFVNQIPLESGAQAALAIKPFAGEIAGFLFAIGLLFAGVIGMIIVPLTSAYAFSEFFGFEGSLDQSLSKSKVFYFIFLVTIIAATILVLTPFFPLFKIALYTQSLNGILLPVFFYFILKIINNKDLMGNNTNGKFYNIFAYSASLIIIVASTLAIASLLFGLIK